MSVPTINPLECPDWNERYVSAGPDAFFNTAGWARVLVDTYGYLPCYVVDGETRAGVPNALPMMDVRSWLTGRRGVGLPFSDHCAAGVASGENTVRLLDTLKGMGIERGWRYFEVRGMEGLPDTIPASAAYWRHDLDLSGGEAQLLAQLDGSVRTSIRKAVKSGVEATVATTLEAVRAFYRLNCETRRRHGLPPQPFTFFRNLHRHVIDAGKGYVVQARHEGRVIAASVYCHHGKHAVYKYGASDYRFQALRGANVVMWEAIRRYAADGFASLAMGRTAQAHEGLRRFKLGWGAAERSLKYIKYDLRAGLYISRPKEDLENGFKLARILPLFVNRLVGSVLYGHMA